MSTTPQYAVTPVIGMKQVTAANTNRDGTGTTVTVLTGGASGTRITSLLSEATVTTTAGMVRWYLTDGVTTRLVAEQPVVANTVAANTPGWRNRVPLDDLVLPSASWSLLASTHNAEAINVFCFGASL